MKLSLTCACGMQYEFNVDPADGRMPYAINCPNCGVDSTEQANLELSGSSPQVVEVFDVVEEEVEDYEIETPAETTPIASNEPTAPAPPPSGKAGLKLPTAQGSETPPAPPGKPGKPGKPGLTLPSTRNAEANHAAATPPSSPAAPAETPTPGKSSLKIGVKARDDEPPEAPSPAGVQPEFEDLAAANEEARRQRMARIKAKQEAEKKQWKKIALVGSALSVIVAGLFGVVIWYVFSGSKPKEFYSVATQQGPFQTSARLLSPGRLLVLDGKGLSLHDLTAGATAWTTELKTGDGAAESSQIDIIDDHAWVFLGNAISKVALADGSLAAAAEAEGHVLRVTASDQSILVTGATGRRGYQTLTRIDPETAETASQDIRIEPSRNVRPNVGGDDNFEPTVANLTAREIRIGDISLRTNWDDFVPAGDNLAQLTVKLETPKITTVRAMKPVGDSVLDQNTSAVSDPTALMDEIVNEISRAHGGATREVNESAYSATLKQHFTKGKTETWKGDLKGAIRFFAGRKVDCLTDMNTLYIFNKRNKLLKKAKLSFPVHPDYYTGGAEVPFLEVGDRLYFFDHGVLTACKLPSGEAAWRFPSVGIFSLEADDDGHLYVQTTTAPPESIQFSGQEYIKNRPLPILIKLDAESGKKLWETTKAGHKSRLAGDYLYATRRSSGSMGALTGASGKDQFTLYRIDPGDGDRVFEKVIQGKAVDYNGTRILIEDGSAYRVYKFLSWF